MGRAVHLPVDAQGRLPRANLWGLAVPVVMTLDAAGLADVPRGTLAALADQLDTAAERCGPVVDSLANPAKALALELAGSLPYVWGASDIANVAADRTAAQLAENAKYPAVHGPLTEVSHNQVVVMAGAFGTLAADDDDIFRDRVDDAPAWPRMRLLLLRDNDEVPEVAARADASREVAEHYGVPCTELRAEGDHPLLRLASLVAPLDFASVYLALVQGIDPSPVEPIVVLDGRQHRRSSVSASGGTRAIVAALFANIGIAITKFIAFLLTGSSSMLAESIHSVADSGNQGLLLVGGRRARREATPEHPFGYGRERYIYAFIVSIVLFSVGGLFALYEGYHKLQHPEPIDAWQWVPVTVLLVAIGLESFSFRTAIVESNQVRGDLSWVQFVRRAKAPELPVVLLEDLGALVGLVLALFGVGLTLITGDGTWDGIGTICIGVLLVVIAFVLALETKSLLLGEGATPEALGRIEAALVADDSVRRIIHMKTMHIGPDELLVAAKIAVAPTDSAAEIARVIDAAEVRIREAEPVARMIYLEPDIERDTTSQSPAPGTART